MTIASGCAELLPTDPPVPPSTFSMAATLLEGRGASALKRTVISVPLPCTGSSAGVVTSSWAPTPRVLTVGAPALAGTTSPVLALTICNAEESKRNCERRCVMGSWLESCTRTSNSSPTFASVGPSSVSAEGAADAAPDCVCSDAAAAPLAAAATIGAGGAVTGNPCGAGALSFCAPGPLKGADTVPGATEGLTG